MKTLSKKLLFLAVLMLAIGSQNLKAQSTVYFFVDFRSFNTEDNNKYVFTVNGSEAFKLVPESKPVDPIITKGTGFTTEYSMVARKVIFKNSGSYVIGSGYTLKEKNFHAEVNLNLEDDETYYVIMNGNIKRNFYMELLDEKTGLKFLKKAQTNKKYTFNEDFVYDGE